MRRTYIPGGKELQPGDHRGVCEHIGPNDYQVDIGECSLEIDVTPPSVDNQPDMNALRRVLVDDFTRLVDRILSSKLCIQDVRVNVDFTETPLRDVKSGFSTFESCDLFDFHTMTGYKHVESPHARRMYRFVDWFFRSHINTRLDEAYFERFGKIFAKHYIWVISHDGDMDYRTTTTDINAIHDHLREIVLGEDTEVDVDDINDILEVKFHGNYRVISKWNGREEFYFPTIVYRRSIRRN